LSSLRAADKHNQKDYSLALEVYETQSADKPHDVSTAKASDGNMYVISCADRSGASRFRAAVKTLEGEKDAATAATVPDCGGLTLIPGVVYRARWQKGSLKILHCSWVWFGTWSEEWFNVGIKGRWDGSNLLHIENPDVAHREPKAKKKATPFSGLKGRVQGKIEVGRANCPSRRKELRHSPASTAVDVFLRWTFLTSMTRVTTKMRETITFTVSLPPAMAEQVEPPTAAETRAYRRGMTAYKRGNYVTLEGYLDGMDRRPRRASKK
jgi:hypothetical protein